jgi:hypothetical protein
MSALLDPIRNPRDGQDYGGQPQENQGKLIAHIAGPQLNSAGAGRLKREVLAGDCQIPNTLDHHPASSYRVAFGIERRESARDRVGVEELANVRAVRQ